MDLYEQAARDYRNDCENADREREQQKREESFEDLSIMEKMRVILKETKELEQLIDERNEKHYWDAKYGI